MFGSSRPLILLLTLSLCILHGSFDVLSGFFGTSREQVSRPAWISWGSLPPCWFLVTLDCSSTLYCVSRSCDLGAGGLSCSSLAESYPRFVPFLDIGDLFDTHVCLRFIRYRSLGPGYSDGTCFMFLSRWTFPWGSGAFWFLPFTWVFSFVDFWHIALVRCLGYVYFQLLPSTQYVGNKYMAIPLAWVISTLRLYAVCFCRGSLFPEPRF